MKYYYYFILLLLFLFAFNYSFNHITAWGSIIAAFIIIGYVLSKILKNKKNKEDEKN